MPSAKVAPFCGYLIARWKWSNKGIGGTISNVSLAVGAVLTALLLCFPKWTHEHVSEGMNAVLVSIAPLVVGGSVFLVRWFVSPYFIYRDLRTKMAERSCRDATRAQLISYLLDLESRIKIRRKMTVLEIGVFENNPDPIEEEDYRLINEILNYVMKNVGVSYGGEFLASTDESRRSQGQFALRRTFGNSV